MKASFFFGILAGIAAVVWLGWSAPFVAQQRVSSETRVQNNGGRLERFEIRLRDDQISVVPGRDAAPSGTTPAQLSWVQSVAPFSQSASVYRLRNESGTVVGMASRVRGVTTAEQVEWVLHIPQRGSLVLTGLSADIAETGEITGGLREFATLDGTWDARLDADDVWRIDTLVVAGGAR